MKAIIICSIVLGPYLKLSSDHSQDLVFTKAFLDIFSPAPASFMTRQNSAS